MLERKKEIKRLVYFSYRFSNFRLYLRLTCVCVLSCRVLTMLIEKMELANFFKSLESSIILHQYINLREIIKFPEYKVNTNNSENYGSYKINLIELTSR